MSKDNKAPESDKPYITKDFDEAQAQILYARGMRDAELVHTMNVPAADIVLWRKKNGLPANRIAMWNTERAMELYNDKAPDKVIAEELSKAGANVSVASVSAWRKQNNLPANSAAAWNRRQTALKQTEAAKSKVPDSAELSRMTGMPVGPFAPDAPKEPETEPKDTRQEKKRRAHLVAVPSSNRGMQEETEPGRRSRRQRVRPAGTLPLTGVFRMPIPDPFAEGLPASMPDMSEQSGDTEQDTVFLLASIINLCHRQFEWTKEDVDDFIDAVRFSEQLMTDLQDAAIQADQKDSPPSGRGRGAKGRGKSKKKGRNKRR